MKPKILPVLEMCIDNGVSLGYQRAHKHTDTPTDEMVKQAIFDAVMFELYEWFEFDGEKE